MIRSTKPSTIISGAPWTAKGTSRSARLAPRALDQFRQVFEKQFMTDIVTRMDDNEAIFKKILDDKEFHDLLFDIYVRDVYKTLREGAA